jgi:hypothetical protein
VDSEIDIVGTDAKAKNYILGECKFRNTAVDIADLDRLKEKSSFLKTGAVVQYALFSKSGFTRNLTAHAKTDATVRLFTLSEIVNG